MSTSGDVESTKSSLPNSLPGSAAGSPRSKVKFLCSHGGKILPRPADGHLKYVGDETRVISVHRNITFIDLMRKLSSLIEGDVVLKYQLLPEDLDALISVKSDEDLLHMFEEYDRHGLPGTPRLRTFLFPANPIILDNQMGPIDRHSLEQRYINSVNGIIVNPTPNYNNNSNFRPPIINTSQTSFTISSACSSPRTPSETAIHTAAPDLLNPEITGYRKPGAMTRARSSPNLCNFVATSQPNHKNLNLNLNPGSTLNLGLTNQQYPYHHQYQYQHRQPPPPPSPHHHLQPYHKGPKPPLDPTPHRSSGPDPHHLMKVRSSDYYRHPMPTDHNQHAPNPYGRSSRSGPMVYQRGSPYEEYYGREIPPGSPLAHVSKWDSVGARLIRKQ